MFGPIYSYDVRVKNKWTGLRNHGHGKVVLVYVEL